MIPIFEQGGGKGIGYDVDSFLNRFDTICAELASTGRARAFAFILYDFYDKAFKQILKDQGVFAQLDRLSGKELSLFYLHAGTRDAVDAFNAHFIEALGIGGAPSLPCVVFFRFEKARITDVEVAQLESKDLIHGFKELYAVIDAYIIAAPSAKLRLRTATIKWLKGSGKFMGIEAFRATLRKGLELLLAST